MTTTQYFGVVHAVKKYTDKNAYVTALSNDGTLESHSEISNEDLEQIWDACSRSIKEIARTVQKPNYVLAQYFAIPQRTWEEWSRGAAECPVYLRLLIQEKLGIFKPPVLLKKG